jgi:hypothetical protein
VGANASTAPANQTWSIDQASKTITLDSGYSITLDNRKQSWRIHDPDGKEVLIWGDPHVAEGDGGRWDFKAQTTFALEDGTKITCKTRLAADGTVSFSDELFITNLASDQAIHVTGIADDNVQIGEVTSGAQGVDDSAQDGYLVTEKGTVEDWTFGGLEVVRDLPFVDYDAYLDLIGMRDNPPQANLLDLSSLSGLAMAAGLSSQAYLDQRLVELEDDLTRRRDDARAKRDQADSTYERQIYADLYTALEQDLKDIGAGRTGPLEDKLTLHNRVAREAELEVKYNLNLTSNQDPDWAATWSEEELAALDEELERLPADFTTFDYALKEIQRKVHIAGSGGVNYGGLITLPEGAGAIRHALIHEIGHDFDDQNPRWEEYKSLSGWMDVTDQFKDISTDYQDDPTTGNVLLDKNGNPVAYDPYNGHAVFNGDGKVYQDGDPIDLDGDGVSDGVVQVHYGQVMVRDSIHFVNDYGGTNPLDDFAITFQYFYQDPQKLQTESPAKYQFMVNYTGQDPLAKAA